MRVVAACNHRETLPFQQHCHPAAPAVCAGLFARLTTPVADATSAAASAAAGRGLPVHPLGQYAVLCWGHVFN